MTYERAFFDPEKASGATKLDKDSVAVKWGVASEADVYVFSPKVILALNVALATDRPLLVAGEPGAGKSRLAGAVAHVLGWQPYRYTVTSRTQAADLLWTFDALQRLNDASTKGQRLKPHQAYVQPGVVWWGFDPVSAAKRGLTLLPGKKQTIDNPAPLSRDNGAVVLVDEIDKADPDVPNDLLEPFDLRQFKVKETDDLIAAKRRVFLLLTTNGERELPPAFLRRCVLLVLEEPDTGWFEKIALHHYPAGNTRLHKRLAAEVMRLRTEAQRLQKRKPSTAEFLDALRVAEQLKIEVSAGSTAWANVIDSTLLKVERAQAHAAETGAPAAGAGNGPA